MGMGMCVGMGMGMGMGMGRVWVWVWVWGRGGIPLLHNILGGIAFALSLDREVFECSIVAAMLGVALENDPGI